MQVYQANLASSSPYRITHTQTQRQHTDTQDQESSKENIQSFVDKFNSLTNGITSNQYLKPLVMAYCFICIYRLVTKTQPNRIN